MESLLYWRLRRWAMRRHPKKTDSWIRDRYWRPTESGNRVFAADVVTKYGNKAMKELYSLPGTAILRHTKIKGAYHPYDPQWELYGETLRQERMLKNMSYRHEWAKRYLDQRGLCALCGYEMNMETGWHDHHMEHRAAGGSDALGNRVLLHPNCHINVHANDLHVAKPVPA